ncbi:hypothetical protein BN132_1976 [Cronobacter turicensis 564]|nr:hypothetical protein BN132_1976 [Cronobacter turicensis 564]
MPRYVQHVVHAPGYPVVTAEVHVFKRREIGLLETFVIAKQRARLPRPGIGNDQVALCRALLRIAFVIHQRRLHAEERTRGGTGFQFGRAGQRRNHEAAGFGLPPGVDDRAFFIADFLPVPLPRLRVNRLADGTKNAQRRTVSPVDSLIAFRHQRANGRRRGIKNIDLVLVHHLRHTVGGGPVRHAFKHQRGGAAGERSVQQITVAGHPAHIRRAPVDIARMVVEGVQERGGRIDQITAGGVQHAFRFTGRAGGIENKQRIFGVHFHRLMMRAGFFDQLVPPEIAPFMPFGIPAGAFKHHHMFHAGDARVFQRVIDIFLKRNRTAGAHAFIGGDNETRAGVDNAPGDGLRREAPENNRVHRADTGAGKHRDGGFRHHRHIDSDHVAFLNAERGQGVREATDVAVKFAVANVFALGGVVAFPDDGGLIAALVEVSVKAVRREVQRAVFIPFNRDIAGRERGVFYLLVGRDPVKDFTLLAPERVRVMHGLLIFRIILFRRNQAAFRDSRGNRVFMDLAHGFFLLLDVNDMSRKS